MTNADERIVLVLGAKRFRIEGQVDYFNLGFPARTTCGAIASSFVILISSLPLLRPLAQGDPLQPGVIRSSLNALWTMRRSYAFIGSR
jgi:hypothetical protein